MAEKETKGGKEGGEAKAKPRTRRAAKPKPKPEEKAKAGAKAKPEPKRSRSGVAKPAGAVKPPVKRTPRAASRSKAKPAAAAEPPVRPVVRAQAKYVRSSARKARLVVDHIRGKDVEQARAILQFIPRDAARDVSKLLESAVANAEHNHELSGDELRITEAFVDEGPTLKRFRPRAQGRATRINKRTSHMTIALTTKETD